MGSWLTCLKIAPEPSLIQFSGEGKTFRAMQFFFKMLSKFSVSTGTAVALGDRPLCPGSQHYWEFELTAEVYGTSFMVGVGRPDQFDPQAFRYKMDDPMLGRDQYSWG